LFLLFIKQLVLMHMVIEVNLNVHYDPLRKYKVIQAEAILHIVINKCFLQTHKYQHQPFSFHKVGN